MSLDLERHLQRLTPARLTLARSGSAPTTRDLLKFQADHALARDAVRRPLDLANLVAKLGGKVPVVRSQATDLETHLLRPDLGRLPNEADLTMLPQSPAGVVVVSDGLSSGAAERYAPQLLTALAWPVLTVVVPFGRVAVGDHIGEAVGARFALVLLGERPGLSAPESLGAYLTFNPKRGRTDAERECISNIRDEGTSPSVAASLIHNLITRAETLGGTGVMIRTSASTFEPT